MAHQALSSAGRGSTGCRAEQHGQGVERDSIFARGRLGQASHAAHARVCHWPPAHAVDPVDRVGYIASGPLGLWVFGSLRSVCSVHADRAKDRKLLQTELL
jgi:hypothetical protein